MKIVYFLGAIILLFAHPKLVAQENQRSNIVKFNFLSAVGRTANVEYERVLFGKFSLNGNIAVYPKQSLPFKSLLNRVTDNSSIIDVAHMSVFSIALEGRYYVNRKSVLDGVYVAPFV